MFPWVRRQATLGGHGGGHAVLGPIEDGEERIPVRAHLDAAGLDDGSPDDPSVFLEDGAVPLFADLLHESNAPHELESLVRAVAAMQTDARAARDIFEKMLQERGNRR